MVTNNEGLTYEMEYDEEDKDIKLEKFKHLIRINEVVAPLGSFELGYVSTSVNPINLSVLVINREGVEGVVPEKGSEREVCANFALRYLRNKKAEQT